eukprot:TRINITY_DN61417_c0_g1_i2.p1 TRINITY_DN61417_c0_g1~~TRINITY_DN61417_c0_g1_i2.p1  ORF type:complete len:417 (-),score=233.12 TRINITY_DN61417_c0_g1_i2:61-1146(-)
MREDEKEAMAALRDAFQSQAVVGDLQWDKQVKALTTVFELASAKSELDHPVCTKCADDVSKELDKRLKQLSLDREAYNKALERLDKEEQQQQKQKDDEEAEAAKLDAEERELKRELLALQQERASLQTEMQKLDIDQSRLNNFEHQFWEDYQDFQNQLNKINNEQLLVSRQVQVASTQLERLKRTNVFDDAFHISYDGHFGTINGFRLGRLPSQPVDWPEINAALGQVCLLLQTVAKHCNFTFSEYLLIPMGSFSKMAKKTDPDTTVELYGSNDINLGRLFWYRRFDQALTWLLSCVKEFGDYAHGVDKKFRLKYNIDKDQIQGLSIKLQFNQDHKWTKALKYMLSNLKFLLAWASKHSGH